MSDPQTLSAFVLSNYIYGHHLQYESTAQMKDQWVCTNSSQNIDFFDSCGKELSDTLNEKFRLPIYVLNFDKIMGAASDKTIDEIIESIHQAVESNDTSAVSQYFTELTDESGKVVTLLDGEFKIYGVSKDNHNGGKDQPGYDLIISQALWYKDPVDPNNKIQRTENVAALRFNEFDKDKIDELKKAIYMNNKSYYFGVGANGTTAAYLLEYPVSVISSMTKNSDGTVVCKLDNKSGIGINIGTGKIILYNKDSNTGEWLLTGRTVQCKDMYLNTAFSKDNAGNASFTVNGINTTSIPVARSNNDSIESNSSIQVTIPRIVLRDYLEATWAPLVTDYNEKLVVFGRKIRFRTESEFWEEVDSDTESVYKDYTLVYNISDKDYCAYFVDINGEKISNLCKLNITDICDIEKLAIGDDGITVIKNEWEKYVVAHFSGITGDIVECRVDTGDAQPKQEELRTDTTVTEIKASCMFPGEYIGSIDIDNIGVEIQRFYCITTTKGMFDSALFSDWINSTEEKSSLEWWNKYLSEKGYAYTVGHDKTNGYLDSRYKYEISQSGIIILDLNTIAAIQRLMDSDADRASVSIYRTIFIVLGILMIAYSMGLVLCWILDVHVDLGYTLLQKVTFGKWIAVQDKKDIPKYNNQECYYIDGKGIMIRALIIVATAIVLMRINVINIILMMIKAFGAIGKYIETMIRGV
jgi:hypothetical protein